MNDKLKPPPGAGKTLLGGQAPHQVLSAIMDNVAAGIICLDEGGQIQSFSRSAEKMFGYTADEIIGQNFSMLILDQHDGGLSSQLITDDGKIVAKESLEIMAKRQDGTTFYVDLSIREMPLGEGLLFVSTVWDIKKRKQAERDAADKSALLTLTLGTMAQGYGVYDADMRLIRYNPQFEALFNYPPGFLHEGISLKKLIRFCAERGDFGDVDVERFVNGRFEDAKKPAERTREHILANGVTYIHHRKMLPGGGCVTTYTDITSLKKAERDAAEKSALLATNLDAMAHGYAIYDADMRLVAFNKQYEDIFKFAEGFLRPGRSMEEVIRHRLENQLYRENILTKYEMDAAIKNRLKRFEISKDSSGERTMNTGTTFVYTRKPMPDGGVVTTYTDITKLREAETALRKTETQLSVLADTTPVLIAYIDRDHIIRFSNKAYAARHGRTPEEICGTPLEQYWDVDRHESVQKMIETTLAGEVTNNEGYREHADGTVRYHVASRAPHFDDEGNVLGCFIVILDTTELKLAEEKLHQAQKMEAIGQLTGGVAHDFNNLLAVIQGNAEMLSDEIGTDNDYLKSVSRAAARGAELTQRLLAFSRLQRLQPQTVDVGELVSGMEGLLQRTLLETVKIETIIDPGLWNPLVDPGQLENALLNLAINARDAMPDGGKLIIGCSNIALNDSNDLKNFEIDAGDYVVIAVSDTGTGMSAEVLDHVFEPFYTTKDVGKGSGLGLSMVYGFARQSGGYVSIYSELDKGTTVRLYLPRATVGLDDDAVTTPTDVPRGQGEAVLIVEDDPDVCSLAQTMLTGLDYRVATALTAAAGLEALSKGEFALVLSDVVLADGISGPKFAEQARALYPRLKVIFMSGYPADTAGFLSADETLINKPFKRQDLAAALRDALA